MSTKIKICGITNVADAREAVAAGADFLGLIFVSSSPRAISHKEACKIADTCGGAVKLVGVFKDSDLDDVNNIAKTCNLSFVQLHGEESPDYCVQAFVPVIKAFEVTNAFTWRNAFAYEKCARYFLLDLPKQSTAEKDGIESVLAIATNAPQVKENIFVAGGLTCENVEAVVKNIAPFAVDVASGVESSPGIKDKLKVEQFCEAVRRGSKS